MRGQCKFLCDGCSFHFRSSVVSIVVVLVSAAFFCSNCADADESVNGDTKAGMTYYVDRNYPGASNLNSGSESSPWLTIQHAADVVLAGDTVYVKAGTYPEHIIVQGSGTAGAVVTFAAYPGHTVIIDGTTVSLPEWDGLVQILGVNYITFRGFTVTKSRPYGTNVGIQVEDASHVMIQNNHTSYTNSSGIIVWNSSSVLVENNEVDHAMESGSDSHNECISVGRSTACEVRGNHVHDGNPVRGEGICIKDGTNNTTAHNNHVHHLQSVGIYLDAWTEHTYNIDVYANRVHDIDGNGIVVASEQGGLLENIKVYNNFSWHNEYLGLNISSCCIASHPMSSIQFINNSTWGNGLTGWGGGFGIDNDQATGIVIRNNACAGNLSFEIAAEGLDPSLWTMDHNLIDGWDGYPGELCGTNCQVGDPRWVNPAAGDLHVQPGSIAINTGSSTYAPTTDIDGDSRPLGAGYDIGADEYNPQMVPTVSPAGLLIAGLLFGLILRRPRRYLPQ